MPDAIRPDARCAFIGATGTGKSTLARWLWATQAGRRAGHRWRVLIDGQDAYELVPEHGTCEAVGVDAVDWRAQVIRIIPRDPTPAEYEEIYTRLNALPGGACVWIDEAQLAGDANRAGPAIRRYGTMGRKLRHMHLVCSQHPVRIEPTLLDQAEHVFCFQLRRRNDTDLMAAVMGIDTGRELRERLRALPPSTDGLPSHHFLHASVASDGIPTQEPLRPEQIAAADQLVRALM